MLYQHYSMVRRIYALFMEPQKDEPHTHTTHKKRKKKTAGQRRRLPAYKKATSNDNNNNNNKKITVYLMTSLWRYNTAA